MGKVIVAFDESEQLILKSIYYDEDPEEALNFVLKHILPKVKKELSCLSGTLSGQKG
ncbi:hypothetical protein SPSIL_046660 [Sporomusa silvacetica DSM 10669]|uniref:Uncharacterized protein n=1 Tax=Sporomusa silvacetica DSM 10669 TaxID=1123289 RepID=A0ABZ3ISU4_9FIRM|nr:hypothetical protein [Sporomusa silvacetica]OZC23439.1 hypothetical protein SPSIL_02210 [Sporomusa silvacetica DSM 10669]OZC23973.1 hypothetical protein SPSIL_00210 [Sporomusa silvacetica DSM 10669]